jgi:glucosyl-dolichyl phosphate glucuronosyltransferase
MITLAICTYNNCNLLSDTLQSISAQTSQRNWATLVIDNNSTDETKHLIDNYILEKRVPNLKYVFEEQQGLTYARRRAIYESEFDLIAFVDDDCTLKSDWVEQAICFCEAHPGAGAVGGQVKLVWGITPPALFLACQASYAAQDYGEVPLKLPSSGFTCLVGAGLIVRRQAIEASGWLQQAKLTDRCGENLTSGGDIEMVFRIRNVGYELWYNPFMTLEHFIPARRISLNYLCRLHREFGRASYLLALLAYNRLSTPGWWLNAFRLNLQNLIRQILGLIVWNIFSFRAIDPMRLVLIQGALGSLEGSLSYACSSFRQRKHFSNVKP